MIIQYVRDAQRNPIGTVISKDYGKVGWSMFNPVDKWDRSVGMAEAFKRHDEVVNLDLRGVPSHKLPSLSKTILQVLTRGRRYFNQEAR